MILMQNMFLAKKINGSQYLLIQDKNWNDWRFSKKTYIPRDQMDPFFENGNIIAVEFYQNDRPLIFFESFLSYQKLFRCLSTQLSKARFLIEIVIEQ